MINNKNILSDIILYSSSEGDIRVEVIYSEETFWLTQKRMGEMFGVDRLVIAKHLQNIFIMFENERVSLCANSVHTAGNEKICQTNI